ncbi:MAG: hypothetical protein GX242_01675, partial [Clostridiales bacterium]|nr:hypothetical protein [Clostridiales bacterium]
VEPRTIVADTINIYESGGLVAGYTDINYYKADSQRLLDRINALIADTQKVLRVGVGFEEARTDLILDRYNLYVDWLRATPQSANYQNSIDYLAYILQNPKGEEVMTLQGTIFTGTINEQTLNVTFSLAGLVISNITLINAEYAESIDAVYLPQKQQDGRINMSSILQEGELYIEIPKVFALTVPVNNLERYASPYAYINHMFERIIMVYYNGITDSEITPVLEFGSYTEDSFNRKVLGITDNLNINSAASETIIYLKKLSAGSAQENIKVIIRAEIDEREARGTGSNITAELYNEFGESCTAEGYLLPTYIDIPYVKSGIVRYYLDETGWRTSETEGSGTARNIELTSINVLSKEVQSYTFYHVLPLHGFREGVIDDRHYYLTVNIPRKNINNVNYTATADDSTYNIIDGYITINNAYLFYDNEITYTGATSTYKTGFNYQKLPEVITARIVPDYFDATSINYFIVSWIPRENAITEADITNGIDRAEKRVLATATILSYYNERGEHVTQTVTVYVEMEAMVFSGIEYSVNGISLDIREDEEQLKNTIVIDPYDEKIGYNGVFTLPTIGLVLNFENNERFTVSPSGDSTEENPKTNDIKRFELLDKDMEVIRIITEIPYGFSGHNLTEDNLPPNKLLYVNMVMFTGQEIVLTINILSRIVDVAEVENIVSVDGEYQSVMLERLYYVDPYNSITHRLPTTAGIFFINSDEYTTLPIIRWEIYDESLGEYRDINRSPYFYALSSSENIDYKYGYYNPSAPNGYAGGVFTLRAYISMGTSASGVNIGEQGFDITIVALNRALKTSFTTTYEYDDPIAGLLSDIGGTLDESMFVDYDKYYAAAFKERDIPKEYYYSAISDGPITPQIDWSRYIDDSIISYEGFKDRSIVGYLYAANTNINYMYNYYKAQVEELYSELIKAMTWDDFFTVESGKLVPLNYYSTDTSKKLKEALALIEIEVKNQTFVQLLQKYNSAENTAYLAQRMESVLLRSVMSNNPDLKNEQEGIAYLYDMLITQNSVNNIKPEDRIILLNWVELYNTFKGNYQGYVENIDAEKLTPYQKIKRDMYDKAMRELYFYGAENTFNDALYAAVAKKLSNNINSAIWQKIFDKATQEERMRMQSIIGQESNVSARANALATLMISDLKTLGSYGETASALISAPKVTFDRFKDNIDTFYFNIYTTLALDEEVYALFLLNKEEIFAELIEQAMLDVIDVYRKGIISTTLQEYFALLKAKMVNTMVPVDNDGNQIEFYYDEAYHLYDYAVDKDTYTDPGKRKAAITAFRNESRQNAIAHIGAYSNESSAKAIWDSLYGAYRIKSNTQMMAVMDDILQDNNNAYMSSLDQFKQYLQNQASKRYDISIEYADKIVTSRAVDSLLSNPKSIGEINNDVQPYMVFAEVYGPSIGELNGPDDIFGLVYNSLEDSNKKALFNAQYNLYVPAGQPHMHTIYYFLHDSSADPTIRRATEDFFYAKLSRAAGKNFFDLLYQKSKDIDIETKETLDIYLNNVQLTGYSNAEYDLELRKARVFRSLQTYYSGLIGEGASYRQLIQDIYDSVLIDIKASAYDRLFTKLFLQFNEHKQVFKENRGDIYALGFDYLLKSFESDADKVISIYNEQITNYVKENIYLYSESLYNKALENDYFVYHTSREDLSLKNYLDLTNEELALIESLAVEYYYYNMASAQEKLKIEAASGIFGQYYVGGNYHAPYGVYQYLIYRYDLGDKFIKDLNELKYFCLLNYAQQSIEYTIREINEIPNDPYYIEHYYNVQRNKINAMGTGIFSDNAILEFAKKGYINYLIEQDVLKNFLSEKQALESNELTPKGREKLYYSIYVNDFGAMLDNGGITLDSMQAFYYSLFSKLPSDSGITSEQLEHILQNHILINGQKASYYDIFASAKEMLEQLELANYNARQEKDKTRNLSVYNKVREMLIQKAREIIDEVINEVEIQYGYVKVFDDLILPYYQEEFILPSYVDNKTREQLKDQLAEIREDSSYVDSDMVILYHDYLDKANDTQKAFIDALCRQEMLRWRSPSIDDHLKTIVYMDLVYLVNTAMTELAFMIDYDLVDIIDIENNQRTVFTDDAKQSYIMLVLELLNEENFFIATAVLQKIIEHNRYTTDFVVEDSTEGMTQEEKNEYNQNLYEYVAYLTKIYDKLLLTAMNQTVKAYQDYVEQGRLLSALDVAISESIRLYLEDYTKDIADTSDQSYGDVLNKMINDSVVEYKFYTQDHISDDDPQKEQKVKRLIYFDVQVLQEEGNSSTQDINKVYLTNLRKKDKSNPLAVIKRDGFRFIYPQIEIVYVDYYGVTDIDDAQQRYEGTITTQNNFLNKITIDPLNPDLPSKVRAYGTYRKLGGSGAYGILDVGMINVRYDEIFRSLEGEYAGNAPESDSSSSYQITAINDKNDEFLISLTVFYLDRTVQSYYVDALGYTSPSNIINSGDYAKYYNLYDSASNKNKIIIDPTAEETVDKDNVTYKLPTSFVANYTNYDTDIYRNASAKTLSYYNVVWDLSDIKYSLSGLSEKPLRILSYYTNVGDGAYNRVEFNYGANSVKITKFSEQDNTIISTNTFIGVPQLDIWNITLTVTKKTVDKIYIRNQDGQDTLFAKFVSDDISGIGNTERWLVAEDDYSVNPYYVEFFYNIVLEFSDGDTYQVNYEFDWIYHSQNGLDKLRDIVNKSITEPNNRYIVAGFNYICENIWVKFMVDDIEIERPVEVDGEGNMIPGYINGGTIYLLPQSSTNMSKEEQFASFYPYLYYNFSKDKFTEDWRRIPLLFSANAIRSIVLSENRVYENIYATLGNNSSGNNISFTVKVINPMLFAKLAGQTNQYVMYDTISMPIDGNSRVISTSSDMPQILGNYFMPLNGTESTLFNILSTNYDVVNEKVSYECRYYMDGSSVIAGADSGVRTLSFMVVLPLSTYNYTAINDVRFDSTNSDKFTWRTVNSFDEIDSLFWKLGEKMTPSLLPKGYDAITGQTFEFMWDLDNININLATGDSYYTIRAYYYASSAQWLYKEVNIYIAREDISDEIVASTNLSMVYNGNRYTYELDYVLLNKLRSDGTMAEIFEDNVTIEYRISTSSEYNYSTTYRPLNAGTYYIRIRVDDYNFFGETIITLVIQPYKIKGMPVGIGGQGIVPDIVFEGVDTNYNIEYTYNGQPQGLIVKSGLPYVHVQNWPQTRDQKEYLYLSKLGANPTSSEITIAKSAAYNELFDKVTPATQVFLSKFKAQVKLDYNTVSDNELNAKVFDLLDYNLYICEVVPTITYQNAEDVILEKEPVDVGSYRYIYNIEAAQNNGNYMFEERTSFMGGWIVIHKQDVTYSLVSNTMVYNGSYQNPLINNLHLPNGNLPIGVSVTYTYSYTENLDLITTHQVKDVRSYSLKVEINGGNNYPDAVLENLTVSIVPQDLLISFDEEKTQSKYLSEIVDYGKHLKFDGLVGNDKASDFHEPVVSGNVKQYYTLGNYPIQINGFKLEGGNTLSYSKYDGDPIEINGVYYYKLILKDANEEGSLYTYLNENNKPVYESLINKFKNYNIYVRVDNFYTIYPDGEAILVQTDEQLQDTIASIENNSRVTIYLSEGSYSRLNINVNASITIIGCYDEDAKIISTLEGITIRQGEVTLQIIDIKGQSNIDSVYIGDKAGVVSILECHFDGLNLQNSRAVVTSAAYNGLLYINKTTITRYTRAVQLLSGTAEITDNIFNANGFGVSSYTQKEVFVRDCTFTSTTNEALYLEYNNHIVIECFFGQNYTAVRAQEEERNAILLQNTFASTNGIDFVSIY